MQKHTNMFWGSDSQEGVSGSMPYVSERVHVDVVVVELFREGGAAGLCKQHTQPAAQILRATGLMYTQTGTRKVMWKHVLPVHMLPFCLICVHI